MSPEQGLLAIGSKCSILTCPNVDYLIYECTNCHSKYCSEHRSVVFDCCQRLSSSSTQNLAKRVKVTCALPDCSDEVFSDSKYCLAHRHKATPIHAAQKGSINAQQASKLEAIKAKFGGKSGNNNGSGSKQQKPVDGRVRVMKTRMNAKPLREPLDTAQRVHVSVSMSEEVDLKACHFYYFSKSLSMGRALDLLAQKFKVNSSQYHLYQQLQQQPSNASVNKTNIRNTIFRLNLSAVADEIPNLDCSHLVLVNKAEAEAEEGQKEKQKDELKR